MIDPKKEARKRLLRAEKILYAVHGSLNTARAVLSVVVGLGKSYEWMGKIAEDVKKTIYSIQGDMESGKCALDSSTVNVLEKLETKGKAKRPGKYMVRLSSVGNPDHGQYAPVSEPKEVRANTLKELWKECQAYIDEWNLGGGNWTSPKVFEANTKREGFTAIGFFSYNSRLWSIHKSANAPSGHAEITY